MKKVIKVITGVLLITTMITTPMISNAAEKDTTKTGVAEDCKPKTGDGYIDATNQKVILKDLSKLKKATGNITARSKKFPIKVNIKFDNIK